jgi:hypothetical protein
VNRRLGFAIALVVLSSSGEAFADDPRAEQLYVEGKQLAANGDYDAACKKFEESQKIEPAIGTQFNLASCYEHTHRPATALAMYREVARIGQMSNLTEREHAAEERIAALEKSAPRIVVQADKRIQVERDGLVMTDAERQAGVIVDPGAHTVHATQEKHLPWSTTIQVAENAGSVVVKVPALAEEPSPPPPPPPPPEGLPPLRIAAIVAASTGAAGLIVGGVFGATAISKKNSAHCNGVDCSASTPDGARSLHDAQTAATTSTVFFIVGGALVAAGAALWVFAPTPTVAVSPFGVEGVF